MSPLFQCPKEQIRYGVGSCRDPTGSLKSPWERHCPQDIIGYWWDIINTKEWKPNLSEATESQTHKSKGRKTDLGAGEDGESSKQCGLRWQTEQVDPHSPSFYMVPQMSWLLHTEDNLHTANVHKASCLAEWAWSTNMDAEPGCFSESSVYSPQCPDSGPALSHSSGVLTPSPLPEFFCILRAFARKLGRLLRAWVQLSQNSLPLKKKKN